MIDYIWTEPIGTRRFHAIIYEQTYLKSFKPIAIHFFYIKKVRKYKVYIDTVYIKCCDRKYI